MPRKNKDSNPKKLNSTNRLDQSIEYHQLQLIYMTITNSDFTIMIFLLNDELCKDKENKL